MAIGAVQVAFLGHCYAQIKKRSSAFVFQNHRYSRACLTLSPDSRNIRIPRLSNTSEYAWFVACKKRTGLLYSCACFEMWPASGSISFSRHSLTAFGDPGMQKIDLPSEMPAMARDITAAEPIS